MLMQDTRKKSRIKNCAIIEISPTGFPVGKKNEVIPNSRNEIFRKWKELDIPCIQNFSEEE